MAALGEPFTQRLLEYIASCGDSSFPSRVRGVAPEQLVEFETVVGAPLPREFRDYLVRMGGDPAGFRVFPDENAGGFGEVLAYYRKLRRDPRIIPPPMGSVVIATGFYDNLALDGTRPGVRPASLWSDGTFHERIADSFEQLCFQQAWWTYRWPAFPATERRQVSGADARAVDRAESAARGVGHSLEPFSDSGHRILTSTSGFVALQRTPDGELYVIAGGQDESSAARLADSIARDTGGRVSS